VADSGQAAAGRLGVEAEPRPLTTGARDGDPLISTGPAGAANFYAERGGFPAPVPPP
jgi:hypothetical protein